MASGQPDERIRVTFGQAARILAPYTWHQFAEQLVVVVPVVLYLALVQLAVLRGRVEGPGPLAGGLLLVVLGLMFFMEGVKIGILPLGETIGRVLPRRAGLPGVLAFSFVVGLVAAWGEPVIGSLQIAGAGVDPAKAPLLHTMLLGRPLILVGGITVGVGVAFLVGMLRYVRGWSLKPLVLVLVGLSAALSVAAAQDEQTLAALGLAWDAGAVIAGPVSTPLVLALGVGLCAASQRSASGMAGFGSVGLMSLFPIAVVLGLILLVGHEGAAPAAAAATHASAAGGGSLALESLLNAVRAIVPVFVVLWAALRFWLREREEGVPVAQLLLAGAFAILGLFLFNYGLVAGLGELGNQVGARLPRSFHPAGEALFSTGLGKAVVVAFGGVLGYGATLAEPAFNTLGAQVEEITQGAFKKWLFGQAVAIGVGVGAALGMASLVYGWPLLQLLLAPYVVLFVLTLLSDERYCSIAWDGGAVTTGPVTVPLKISIGIALSHATGFAEGFGVLALASAYPVLNILLIGLYVRRRERKAGKVPR